MGVLRYIWLGWDTIYMKLINSGRQVFERVMLTERHVVNCMQNYIQCCRGFWYVYHRMSFSWSARYQRPERIIWSPEDYMRVNVENDCIDRHKCNVRGKCWLQAKNSWSWGAATFNDVIRFRLRQISLRFPGTSTTYRRGQNLEERISSLWGQRSAIIWVWPLTH